MQQHYRAASLSEPIYELETMDIRQKNAPYPGAPLPLGLSPPFSLNPTNAPALSLIHQYLPTFCSEERSAVKVHV